MTKTKGRRTSVSPPKKTTTNKRPMFPQTVPPSSFSLPLRRERCYLEARNMPRFLTYLSIHPLIEFNRISGEQEKGKQRREGARSNGGIDWDDWDE